MGIFWAFIIISLWTMNLVYSLFLFDLVGSGFWWIILVVTQTYLFTGLFITAHDSMHGSICKNRKLNSFIGRLSLVLFAAFSYSRVYKEHIAHHRYPGTEKDPDFSPQNQRFFPWLGRFLIHYITPIQIGFMAAVFMVMQYVLKVPVPNLLLLWILPALLSTVQLFMFGTYLPHRRPHNPEMKPHNARTQKKNHILAMLSCYFFGYHFEHHVSPRTPWWKLYAVKQEYEAGTLVDHAGLTNSIPMEEGE